MNYLHYLIYFTFNKIRKDFFFNNHLNKKKMINERNYYTYYNTKILLFISLISTSSTILLLFVNHTFNRKAKTEDIDIYNKTIKPRDTIEEKSKYSLLSNLDDIITEGFWKDNQQQNGSAFIYYSTNNKTYPTKLKIIFRLIYGKTIGNWNIIYSTIYTKNIFCDLTKLNEATFITNSSIIIEKGKIFKRETFHKAESIIQLNITKDNSSIIKIDGFIQIKDKKRPNKIFFGSIRQEYTEYE